MKSQSCRLQSKQCFARRLGKQCRCYDVDSNGYTDDTKLQDVVWWGIGKAWGLKKETHAGPSYWAQITNEIMPYQTQTPQISVEWRYNSCYRKMVSNFSALIV